MLHRRGTPAHQPARTPGAVHPPRDEARILQHLEVARDRRLAHLEGLGQLHHPGFALGQSGQESAPGGIGESGENFLHSVHRVEVI